MRWTRLPVIPAHLVHQAMGNTVTVVTWLLVGFLITAVGGWTAFRATTGRRVSAGMAVTLAGVIVSAAGIWNHTSMPN